MGPAEILSAIPGIDLVNKSFFNEFTLRLPCAAAPVVDALAGRGILAGIPVSRLCPGRADIENLLLVAVTEMVTSEDIDHFATALGEVLR